MSGATKKVILTDTVKLNADIDANLFVQVGGVLPAAGGTAWGVTASSGKDGDYVPVDILGITVVTAGGAIAAGAEVKAAATGKALTHTAGTTRRGLARTAAAADGDDFELFLTP